MKQLQIACVPANWDKSTITATGLTRNGRAALPRTTTAADLPEPWFSVWRGIVAALESLDPNGWAASFIIADKRYTYPTPPEPVGEQVPEQPQWQDEPVPYIHLTIHRRWDDNTTAEPIELPVESQEAVALFDHLTEDNVPGII